MSIVRACENTIRGFLPSNSTGPAKLECLDWKRLGIMPGDIEEYNLDTSQKGDTKTKAFLAEYGSDRCVEIDALPREMIEKRT